MSMVLCFLLRLLWEIRCEGVALYIYNVREEYWGRLICVFVSVWLEIWEKIQVGGHMVKLGFE